jgi:hypothetical protein
MSKQMVFSRSALSIEDVKNALSMVLVMNSDLLKLVISHTRKRVIIVSKTNKLNSQLINS